MVAQTLSASGLWTYLRLDWRTLSWAIWREAFYAIAWHWWPSRCRAPFRVGLRIVFWGIEWAACRNTTSKNGEWAYQMVVATYVGKDDQNFDQREPGRSTHRVAVRSSSIATTERAKRFCYCYRCRYDLCVPR